MAGFKDKKNGELLLAADHGIPRQQKMAGRSLAIVLVRSRTNQLEDLLPLAPVIINVLESSKPGQIDAIPVSG
jgi:hypothetical protein